MPPLAKPSPDRFSVANRCLYRKLSLILLTLLYSFAILAQEHQGELDAIESELTSDPDLEELLSGLPDLALSTEHKSQLENISLIIKETRLSGRAWDLVHQGDLEQAIRLFKVNLDSARKRQDSIAEAQSLENIGSVVGLSGDIFEARAAFQELRAVALRLDDKALTAKAEYYLAANQLLSGQIEEAEINLEKALSLAQEANATEVIGLSHYSLGNISLIKNNLQETLDHWQIQYELHPIGSSVTLESLAWLHASVGNFPLARRLAKGFLKASKNSLDIFSRISAWATHGYVLAQAGNLEVAESSLKKAIALYESSWHQLSDDQLRVSARDLFSVYYEVLQKTQSDSGKIEAALATSEAARAQAFLRQMADRQASPARNKDQRRDLIHTINLDEIRALARRNNSTYLVYDVLFDPSSLLLGTRFAGLQENLEQSLSIWIVRPNGQISFQAVDLQREGKPSLSNLVKEARWGLEPSSRGAKSLLPTGSSTETRSAKALRNLAEVLVDPVASFLPPPEGKIVFVPRGNLFSAPFAALPLADGRPLVESYEISIVPSLSIAKKLEDRRARRGSGNKKQVLVIGDPETPTHHRDLPRLPGARREALQVAEMLGTKPLLGPAATREAVVAELENASTVHLATHGLLEYDNERGLPGAFVLAPDGTGETDDGLLTADRISDLRLQADLVVASACDSGSGQLTGDGVLGLSRVLLTSGAGTVVVSLWQIDDESTFHLMSDFYRYLDKHPGRVAAALRFAMLETRKKYPDPWFWAGFITMGPS